MDYTVLARRFRPQSFGEIVGQDTISQALRNAIESERVAHAYLFTGARGVGKTSTARILAKSLNCPNAVAGDPCNQCEVCRGISVGSDVDVIEIDGASNRGIDEIRDLRANVNIKPMRCPYKIYIIDEVHMLTTPAFNALLKTLEEPPPNVKFIFCTTDPQKVPETILSRCQRFDFGTIATDSIRRRLAEIAVAEGVTVDPAALELVARRAAGSMRDSQSLFDQLLAYGGARIGADAVHRLLGTAPDDWLIAAGRALAERDRRAILDLVRQALDLGAQLGELTDQLILYLRDLMVLATGAADAPLLSVSEESRSLVAAQARAWGLTTILAALQILSEAKGRMKGVSYGRVLVEMALVRMASLEDLDRVADLIELVKSGKVVAGGTVTAPAVRRSLPPTGGTEEKGPGGAVVIPNTTRQEDRAAAIDVSEGESPGTTIDSVPSIPKLNFEPGNEMEIWAQAVSLLSSMTKSHAKNVSSAAISGPNQLVLTFPKSYDLSRQNFERSPDQVRLLQEAVEQVVGRPVRIVLATAVPGPEPGNEPKPTTSRPEIDQRKPDAANDQFVQKALAVFDATVVRVDASNPLVTGSRE
jgi:DNA polymerase III subunit gamma/tau